MFRGRKTSCRLGRYGERVAGGSCWIEGRRGLKGQERGSARIRAPVCPAMVDRWRTAIVESFQHRRTSMGCSSFVTKDAPIESLWVEMAAYSTRLAVPLSVAVGRVMRTATCSQQLSCNDVDAPVTVVTGFGLKLKGLVNLCPKAAV